MDYSTPSLLFLHYPMKFAQTCVHWVTDNIQSPHPLSPSSPLAFNLSYPQGLFSNESAFHIRWPKYWSFSISPSNEYSRLISFRIDWFVQGTKPCCPRDSQESSPASQFKNINSLALCLLYDPTLTSVHAYWKDHSFDYMDLCCQNDVFAF